MSKPVVLCIVAAGIAAAILFYKWKSATNAPGVDVSGGGTPTV